ncbi:MAG: CvpA family protein [Chitinivibrionales bacterium]|nr:CvpA family protein [Chitinivibrionales bacterium]
MVYGIDICFGLIALVFIALGFKRGFIGEIVRLIAIIGGFLVALSLARQCSAYFTALHFPFALAYSTAFFSLYILFALIVLLIGWIIKKIVHLTLLGWLDKLLGVACGVIKAFFFGWVIVLISTFCIGAQTQRNLLRSPTYRAFAKFQPQSLPLVNSIQKAVETVKSHDPFGQLQKTKARFMGGKKTVDTTIAPEYKPKLRLPTVRRP